MLTNLPSLEPRQKSTTETLSPLYRKLSGLKMPSDPKHGKTQITVETIRQEYSHLSLTIDNLEAALDERMSVHERELLSIMKIQIEKMLDDVRKVVKVFNIMIREKNFSQDLWETKNEMEYFKFQAFRLFEENKSLKRQISALKQQIQSLNFQQKCQTIALKKMARRLVKEKAKRNGVSAEHFGDQKSIQIQLEKSSVRKRHVSLYTSLQKGAYKPSPQKVTPKHESHTIKTNIESTISQTKGKRIKTQMEAQQNQSNLYSKDSKIMLFNNQGRSQKMKLLKQKVSLCKNKFKEHRNDPEFENFEKD